MTNKISFANMKLKADTSVNTFDFLYGNNTYKVEVKRYLPISDKNDLIQIALQRSEENGIYNEVALEMNFNLNIVFLYTNISFTDKQKEDLSELYDKLQCSGLIDAVIAHMDQDEYKQLLDYLEKTKADRINYNSSAAGLVQDVLEEFPKKAQEAADIINNINPNQFKEAEKLVKMSTDGGINNNK